MEWKLWFLAVECKFFKDLRNYEEEKEVKEMTRKILEGIDIFESKNKEHKGFNNRYNRIWLW